MVQKKYTQANYFYVFETRPELNNQEIAKMMNVMYQGVANYRQKFKKNPEYNNDNAFLTQEFMDKVKNFVPKEKKVVVHDEKLEVPKVDFSSPSMHMLVDYGKVIIPEPKALEEVWKVTSPRIEELKKQDEYYEKKKEISNEELIILNNKISITSNRDEVSQLVYGIYHLLLNNPADVKIKLDLNFEVSK